MWTSFQPNWDVYIQHQYPCPRGGGQAVQAGLSCPPPRICVRQCNPLHHNLGIFSLRDINIISVRCLHPLSEEWGASCPGWFILPPTKDLGQNSVISSFLLHHNLGIFSCKRCEHYFSQTECLHPTSSVWLPLSEEWGASCPGWFICPLVRGVAGKDLGPPA